MKKQFSKNWKSSKQKRKKRKYLANAPLHIRQKMLSANLSKDLRKKYKKRNITARTGDKVKVLRGQFKGKTGEIQKVFLKKSKLYIENVQHPKKDGTKSYYPINPSNIQIIELNLEDKKRKQKLTGEKNEKTS